MSLTGYFHRNNGQRCCPKFKTSLLIIQNLPYVTPGTHLPLLYNHGQSLIQFQAFLTAQIALTGLPILLFITFGITVFLFALIAALLIALVAALLFTVLMVGVALVVVLPTIFLTTFTATFVFLWGLGGYYILKWFNDGGVPAPDGKAIGDKLNSLTGGRMGWLMDGTRKKAEDSPTAANPTSKAQGKETNGHSKDTNTKGDNEKKENGSANSTGVSGAGNHANEAKETVTKRPPKLNTDKSTNSGKSGSSGATGEA